METLFNRNLPEKPLVSFVLIDWSCRESFHLLHYLNKQNIERDRYEIIWIEFYGTRATGIKEGLDEYNKSGRPPFLDKWIVMDMPEDVYYHKHLAYNVGIAHSSGEIVSIFDSDSVVKPTFVESIVNSFKEDDRIILHLDTVRNTNHKFYPFTYPEPDEIFGEGCWNWKDGTTIGLVDKDDPLHTRNYGGCMCAKRSDIIAIGGSDEHIDFLGYICGPYDLTFRLINYGLREVWHPTEFLFHFWHPGMFGEDNYIGPSDGKQMSSTALEAIDSGRIMPLLENDAIKQLRTKKSEFDSSINAKLTRPDRIKEWSKEELIKSKKLKKWSHESAKTEIYETKNDYNLIQHAFRFYGVPMTFGPWDPNKKKDLEHKEVLCAESKKELEKMVNSAHFNRPIKRFFQRLKKMTFLQ